MIFFIAILLVLSLLGLGGFMLVQDIACRGKIFRGITIDGKPVGDLQKDTARSGQK